MLKKAVFISCWLGVLTAGEPLYLQAGDYHYDQGGSRVSFTLKHFGILTVSGDFKKFSGSFRFDPDQIENSYVDINIDTATVDSGNEMRDRHLRSQKFFCSAKHPQIHFLGQEFKRAEGMNFDVYGDLTIRGITQPVVFKTVFLSESVDAHAGRPISFRAETHIRRKDFELGTGRWLDPVFFVADETLKIRLEITGRPADI